MKRLFYILFFILPISGLAQNDTIINNKNTYFKNQVDLSIHLTGIEGSYKRRLSRKFFIGGSFGFGLLVRIDNINESGFDGFVQMRKFKLFLDYSFTEKFHGNFGLSSSLSHPDMRGGGYHLIGLETGFFYKIWKLELGIEPSIIFIENEKWLGVLTTSFFIIKIPLGRW